MSCREPVFLCNFQNSIPLRHHFHNEPRVDPHSLDHVEISDVKVGNCKVLKHLFLILEKIFYVRGVDCVKFKK